MEINSHIPHIRADERRATRSSHRHVLDQYIRKRVGDVEISRIKHATLRIMMAAAVAEMIADVRRRAHEAPLSAVGRRKSGKIHGHARPRISHKSQKWQKCLCRSKSRSTKQDEIVNGTPPATHGHAFPVFLFLNGGGGRRKRES
jgi:hypothetical protein